MYDLPEPKTRLEQYWKGILDKKQGITVRTIDIAKNGTYTADENEAFSSVSVKTPIHTVVQPKDVIFVDYDGVILYSYSASEFLELDAMPDPPDHSTEDYAIYYKNRYDDKFLFEWNYRLSDAKEYVQKYGKLVVGALHSFSYTYLFIRLESSYLSPLITFKYRHIVTIDWGDETTETLPNLADEQQQVSVRHTYAKSGNYVIRIRDYDSYGRTMNGTYVKYNSDSLIRNSEDENDSLNAYYKKALKGIFIAGNSGFDKSEINGFIGLEFCNATGSKDSTEEVNIKCFISPNSGSERLGSRANCKKLEMVSYPQNSIYKDIISNRTFENCESLKFVTLPHIRFIGDKTFKNCKMLEYIVIPDSITQISIEAFYGAESISSLKIPQSVIMIRERAFYECSSLREIRFEAETPPQVLESAFYGISDDCVIYVPASSMEAYTHASNYPNPQKYTYIGY